MAYHFLCITRAPRDVIVQKMLPDTEAAVEKVSLGSALLSRHLWTSTISADELVYLAYNFLFLFFFFCFLADKLDAP